MVNKEREISKGSPRRLKEIRQQLGLSQLEFAQQLGVKANTYARWERSDLEPPLTAELAGEYLLTKLKKGRRK